MNSKFRYCLTNSGEVCFEDNADAAMLLVGKGCEVEDSLVSKYGFVDGAVTTPNLESKEAPAVVVPEPLKLESKEEPKVEEANAVTDLRESQEEPKAK